MFRVPNDVQLPQCCLYLLPTTASDHWIGYRIYTYIIYTPTTLLPPTVSSITITTIHSRVSIRISTHFTSTPPPHLTRLARINPLPSLNPSIRYHTRSTLQGYRTSGSAFLSYISQLEGNYLRNDTTRKFLWTARIVSSVNQQRVTILRSDDGYYIIY